MGTTEKKNGLELLREPFPENQISKLPKGTKAQNDCPPNEKVNCKECGGWHHPRIIHLSYVGHAALTDRLLDADPLWTWEPLALKDGLPAFDGIGGLWIKLTVCGHSRIGYGNAAAASFRTVGDREKEVIGDALRNAAMRFGAALDLWHKGELHVDDGNGVADKPRPEKPPIPPPNIEVSPTGQKTPITAPQRKKLWAMMTEAGLDKDDAKAFYDRIAPKTSKDASTFIESFATLLTAWKRDSATQAESEYGSPVTCPPGGPKSGEQVTAGWCKGCEQRSGCPAWPVE
jgi:hypothetical protein